MAATSTSDDAEANLATARQQLRKHDIDQMFSFKYPPDEKNYKYYLFGMALVIGTLIITIIGVANSPGHVDHTFDFEDWKFKSFKIGGTFRLSNHDEKFDDYLKSLDIPQFAIEMIKSAKEIIQVVEPTQTNPNWTLKMSTDFHEHEVTFRMDEAFHIPWENGKSISHFCKRPQYAVIECTTKEPMKNWNLRTRMIFSDLGLIDEKTNLDHLPLPLSTNKTYVRVKDDGHENIEDELRYMHQSTEKSPTNGGDEDFNWE